MKKWLLMVIIAFAAAGCARPALPPSAAPAWAAARQNELWKIQIIHWGTLKFSGLLGIRHEHNALYHVLLDATGIKLLEARVTAEGAREPIRDLSVLEGHRLPEFLSATLYRIFLLAPGTTPGGWNLLPNLRLEENEGRLRKVARWGPLVLWSVEYLPGGAQDAGTRITFSAPWKGVTLTLTRDSASAQIN